MNFTILKQKLLQSKLAKDSFWAVFGNGLGNFLLLLAGIGIARLLGKDLYGEYGVVKTTMFYMAAVATFGGHYTSTKYVADYLKRDITKVKSIVYAALKITIYAGSVLFILLLALAEPLSVFLKEPSLAMPFRFLGIIILVRGIATTEGGILGGFKAYKELGINNILSGATLLILGAVLTYFWGLTGSLVALLSSQIVSLVLNSRLVIRLIMSLPSDGDNYVKEIAKFSLPVVLQELTYSLCNWGSTIVIARYASMGELGIFTAAAQWNAIVSFFPGLLTNVVLSYLSDSTDKSYHVRTMKKMVIINLISTLIPFLLISASSGIIVSLYGDSFDGLQIVLNVIVFGSVISVVSTVFQSNLLSEGKNWRLFIARLIRDCLNVVVLYYVLYIDNTSAALKMAIIGICVGLCYLITLIAMNGLLVKRRVSNIYK